MMVNPFFSIIMPVYGVELYLADSVASVLKQTDRDFELILVDDCSKDRSGAICDELAASDERIRVLHLEQNGGLSNARNSGMKLMRGAYVFFMDSDDEISEDLLSTVRAALERNPAEVTAFGFVEEYFDAKGKLGHTRTVSMEADAFYEEQTELRGAVIALEKQTLYGYACNKVYNTGYLRRIGARFETIPLIEDIQFNVSVFNNIERLNILRFTPYFYKKRINGSLTNKFVPDYFVLHRKRVQMIFDQYSRWGMLTEPVKTTLAQIYVRYILSALQRNCEKQAGMDHAERKKWLRALYEDQLWQALSPSLPRSRSMIGMTGALLSKQMSLCVLAEGRFVYWVRKYMPLVFSKVKGRN